MPKFTAPNLAEVLSEMKSAEVVTDPGAVLAHLNGRANNKADQNRPVTLERTDGSPLLQLPCMLAAPVELAAMGDFDPASAAEARGIRWDDSMAEDLHPWWASDERVDRHGDIVRQHWDLANYARNPVLLYGHSWDMPPIGASLAEQTVMRADDDYAGPALLMRLLVSQDWDLSQSVGRLVRSGILRTGSVGFYPGAVILIRDPAERNRLGLGEYGAVYGTAEAPNQLIEMTLASVPANVGADRVRLMRAAAESGQLARQDLQTLRELARRNAIVETRTRPSDLERTWAHVDQSLRLAWRCVFDGDAVPDHVPADETVLLQEIPQSKGRRTDRLRERRDPDGIENPGTKSEGDEPAGPTISDVLEEVKAVRAELALVRADVADTKSAVDGVSAQLTTGQVVDEGQEEAGNNSDEFGKTLELTAGILSASLNGSPAAGI